VDADACIVGHGGEWEVAGQEGAKGCQHLQAQSHKAQQSLAVRCLKVLQLSCCESGIATPTCLLAVTNRLCGCVQSLHGAWYYKGHWLDIMYMQYCLMNTDTSQNALHKITCTGHTLL
jgi:hypothetical protein